MNTMPDDEIGSRTRLLRERHPWHVGSNPTPAALQEVIYSELLATGATPEQLMRGMRRLMACIRHGKGNPCELCKDDE
jgi:hypothetical protein